jgi:tripartite-type tricarboxylate transporter receptor subunit TctC
MTYSLGTAGLLVAASMFISSTALVHAQQEYPVRPITLLIPFPPGSGNDVVGHIVANKLPEYLGQRVIPDNRAGKVQVFGVTGSKRSALMPAVPTFTEQGYPRLDIPSWFPLLGPAGLPGGAVKALS